eukprot:s915_g3.t1
MEVVLAAHGDGLLATDLRSGALVASYEEGGQVQPNAFGCVDTGGQHIYAVQASSLVEFVRGRGVVFRRRCQWHDLRMARKHWVSAAVLARALPGGDTTVGLLGWWISGHSLTVTSLAFLGGASGLHHVVASGRCLAGLDRSVQLWDVGTGRPIQSRSLNAQVHSLCAGAAASELVVAGAHGELRSLEVKDFSNEGGVYLGHTSTVLSCAMSLDGSRIASCSEVERVRVWETRTRQCLAQVHANRDLKVSAVKIVSTLGEKRLVGGF